MVNRLSPLHGATVPIGRTPAHVLSRISPVLSDEHGHPDLPDDLEHKGAILATRAALADVYTHHRNRRQIESCLMRLGLTDVVVLRDGNGIEARGRRPARDS